MGDVELGLVHDGGVGAQPAGLHELDGLIHPATAPLVLCKAGQSEFTHINGLKQSTDASFWQKYCAQKSDRQPGARGLGPLGQRLSGLLWLQGSSGGDAEHVVPSGWMTGIQTGPTLQTATVPVATSGSECSC